MGFLQVYVTDSSNELLDSTSIGARRKKLRSDGNGLDVLQFPAIRCSREFPAEPARTRSDPSPVKTHKPGPEPMNTTSNPTAAAALADAIARTNESRARVSEFTAPAEGYIVRMTDSPTMTLTTDAEGLTRFAATWTPFVYGAYAAKETARRWNAANPKHAVTVCTAEEWKAAQLAEFDSTDAFLAGYANGAEG